MPTSVPSTTRTLVVPCPAAPLLTVQLDFDEDIRTVSLQGFDATAAPGAIETACYYSFVEQAEGDPIHADRKTVSAGGLLPVVISGQGRALGGTSIHVASSVASGVVELVISTHPFS